MYRLLPLVLIVGLVGCEDARQPLTKPQAGSTLSGPAPMPVTVPAPPDDASESKLPAATTDTTSPGTPAEVAATAPSDATPSDVPAVEADKSAPAKAKRPEIYDPKADAKQLIAAAVEKAKLENKHVLIEWGGNWCGWCYKLHDVFHNDKLVRPIVHEEFELVLIDCNSNMDLMKGYGGQDRRYSYPHLTILDANGQTLTNQETGSLEIGPKHDPEKVAAFLKQWMPEHQDAENLLTAALKRAGDEDKSVLLQVGDPYCGWCKRFSKFMHENQQTFDQDYVHLKIDTLRMMHGVELEKRLQPEDGPGHPWVVILDPQGKVLSTSIGSMGNIGYPYKPEEVEHFITMLKSTKKRLQDADLAKLRDALNAFREAREKKAS